MPVPWEALIPFGTSEKTMKLSAKLGLTSTFGVQVC